MKPGDRRLRRQSCSRCCAAYKEFAFEPGGLFSPLTTDDGNCATADGLQRKPDVVHNLAAEVASDNVVEGGGPAIETVPMPSRIVHLDADDFPALPGADDKRAAPRIEESGDRLQCRCLETALELLLGHLRMRFSDRRSDLRPETKYGHLIARQKLYEIPRSCMKSLQEIYHILRPQRPLIAVGGKQGVDESAQTVGEILARDRRR